MPNTLITNLKHIKLFANFSKARLVAWTILLAANIWSVWFGVNLVYGVLEFQFLIAIFVNLSANLLLVLFEFQVLDHLRSQHCSKKIKIYSILATVLALLLITSVIWFGVSVLG